MKQAPTLNQYNEAILHPGTAFSDPVLAAGKAQLSPLGVPLVLCGNFAYSYVLNCGSQKYGVRCFRNVTPDLDSRYAAISTRIKNLHSPWFIDFDYQPKGISIDGNWWPILKMEWVPGETLGTFMENCHADAQALANLDDSLNRLSKFLRNNGIAHGDIQPGNIMVADNGRSLRLIDYDGMYLDEISHLGCLELGLRNFQHPGREPSAWGPGIDGFSFILLHVVLTILQADPSIWHSTKSDSDIFIFTANDLASPQDSATFSQLLGNSRFESLARKLQRLCLSPVASVTTLAEFLGRSTDISLVPTERFNLVKHYLGNYPVMDALNYDMCLINVGSVVELVGRITEVKRGYTRHHRPYVFINFTDWKGKAVKISIWPQMLKKAERDFDSLKDKYISITGLLEPPYEGYSYTHISINYSDQTPLREISQAEAEFRLKSIGQPAYDASSTGQPHSERTSRRANKQILDALNSQWASGKQIRPCPRCGKGLRFPAHGTFDVTCPACRHTFRSQGTAQSDSGEPRHTRSNADILRDLEKRFSSS